MNFILYLKLKINDINFKIKLKNKYYNKKNHIFNNIYYIIL